MEKSTASPPPSPSAKKYQFKNQVNFLMENINELVYKLYNLNEDEIKIIEGEKE